ncbi:MAG: hypothetical protein ABS81_18720 [Pseudonocardia sp. SCN 72-86]|nr:MAG: hypothetical protein ABS81_18720 [Pseudonocardia sp. SCN 72-86]
MSTTTADLRAPHGRRGGVLAAIATVLLLMVGACGGGGTSDQPAPTTTAAASADVFPQTLTSPYGQTTLPAAPQRVVALGVAERDTVLALGIVPVAAGGYGDLDPWFTAKAAGVENLELSDGIPFEKIAAVRPDLIITGWGQEADYTQLSAIAPVLWQVSATFATDWRAQATTIAITLGKSADGARLVAETDAKVKAAAAANPSFAGKTFTWSTYDSGTASTVDLPTAPVVGFLGDLGLRLKPELANPASAYARDVSTELLETIDADVVIVYPGSPAAKAELEGMRTWQRLRGVEAGGAVFLDDAQANGLNSPTLLSIPFVLDQVTPMLAKATA